MINLNQLKVGMEVKTKTSQPQKIVAIVGEAVALSYPDGDLLWYTVDGLNYRNYTLVSEPQGRWRPEATGGTYFMVNSSGDIYEMDWDQNDKDCEYRYKIGNVHPTEVEAEAYKQKLIALAAGEKE